VKLERAWYARIQNIDRRLIYLILVIAILLPLRYPLGLPIRVGDEEKSAFQVIDNLKEGAIVLLSINTNPGTQAENWPAVLAIGKHLMSKGAKIVLISLFPDCMMFSQKFLNEVALPGGYEYGKDIVLLGFASGQESVVAGMANDLASVYKTDYKGKPLSDLPVMAKVASAKDFDLAIDVCQFDSTNWFIRHVAPKGTPVIAVLTAVMTPGIVPFYASRQVAGIVSGLAGSAAYERLIKQPGSATSAMDAQSLGHGLVAGLVILGNLGYFVEKRRKVN